MTDITPAPERRLRISHLTIQPVLVWDDGSELSPGPELQPVQVNLTQGFEVLAGLPDQVAALAKQLAEHESENPFD